MCGPLGLPQNPLHPLAAQNYAFTLRQTGLFWIIIPVVVTFTKRAKYYVSPAYVECIMIDSGKRFKPYYTD